MKLKDQIRQIQIFLRGWKSKRKIVVIESDDWGSIRMPSEQVLEAFIRSGFNLKNSIYNRFDSLESNNDLGLLLDLLLSFKNQIHNPPVITANMVVCNPDFHKIQDSGYTRYFYQPVSETIKEYPGHDKVIDLWIEGENNGLFHPQFHGREHVNIHRWLAALQAGDPFVHLAFNLKAVYSGNEDYNYMEVLDYDKYDDLSYMSANLIEGLAIFKEIFGYCSTSFIPPCYTWHSDIEESLANHGIKYIQGIPIQFIPTGTFNKYKTIYHFLGERNRWGQYYLTRNCHFEPSLVQGADAVDKCLKKIKIAFLFGKPAIISSHRINYIGSISSENRNRGLSQLKCLIDRIIKLWPDVEFMTTDQLGDLLCSHIQQVQEGVEN